MNAIILLLLALLGPLVSWCLKQDEQCSYEVLLLSKQRQCRGISGQFCDSWDNGHNKPSGNCVTYDWGGDCLTDFHAPGPCIDICSVQLFGSHYGTQLNIRSEAMDEQVIFDNLEPELNSLGNQCARKPDPGTKFIKIPSSFTWNAFVQIPESCTFDGTIECGAGCEPAAPPPSGGECLYEIKIKTSCAAFSGNPSGTVGVSIADDVSGGRYPQLAGNILSFRNLDNPGVADFRVCTLATFFRTDTCISFCSMELRLDNTGLKWSVDYVQVSNKYVTKKFDIYVTLRPSKETQIGDHASVLSAHCARPPPNYMDLPGVKIQIPGKCVFKEAVDYGDGYSGSLNCDCIQHSHS